MQNDNLIKQVALIKEIDNLKYVKRKKLNYSVQAKQFFSLLRKAVKREPTS